MRFKLSSLLITIPLLAVTIGLAYHVHLLRQQVADLKTQMQGMKGVPVPVFIAQPVAPNQPNRNRRPNSPFRLLNSNGIVIPAVEQGMQADEWQRKQQWERRMRVEPPLERDRVKDGFGRSTH